jgi:hypothetical protein
VAEDEAIRMTVVRINDEPTTRTQSPWRPATDKAADACLNERKQYLTINQNILNDETFPYPASPCLAP